MQQTSGLPRGEGTTSRSRAATTNAVVTMTVFPRREASDDPLSRLYLSPEGAAWMT